MTMQKPAARIRPHVFVQTDMRRRIQEGEWFPGLMIPSRKDLAVEYGVALSVIERAVTGLLSDGTLHAMDRRGTFVARDPVAPDNGARPPAPAPPIAPIPAPADSERLVDFSRLTTFANIGIVSTMNPLEDGTRLADYWRGVILNAVERTISHAGGISSFYNLYRPDGTTESLRKGIDYLLKLNVKAIIVIRQEEPRETAELLALMEGSSIPLVFVISNDAPPSVLSVYCDGAEAGFQAARHLLERNHEDVHFFSPYRASWVSERLAGVQSALTFYNPASAKLHVEITGIDLSDTSGVHETLATEAARQLLAHGRVPRAVIAANDQIAYGFMIAAADAGLSAGIDYAIIGFDDLPPSRAAGLSSLHPPLEALGKEATHIAIRVLNGDSTKLQVRLTSSLVARSSSQPLA